MRLLAGRCGRRSGFWNCSVSEPFSAGRCCRTVWRKRDFPDGTESGSGGAAKGSDRSDGGDAMKKGTYISLLAGYAVTVAVYGMWQHFGLPLLPLVFALPVFYLAVVSLVPTKWHGSFMSLGLLMSAAGDYCGESGMFLLQASFFAVAHIFYAVYFLRGAWFRPSSLAAALLLCAAVAVAASRIIPAVGNPTEHGAVVVYAVLITLMCASSFFWRGKGRGWYIAGALLFSSPMCSWPGTVSSVLSPGAVSPCCRATGPHRPCSRGVILPVSSGGRCSAESLCYGFCCCKRVSLSVTVADRTGWHIVCVFACHFETTKTQAYAERKNRGYYREYLPHH